MAMRFNGRMDAPRPLSPPPSPPWAVCLAGALALAVAMGIGRFAFTPLLPLMQREGLLGEAGGAALAASNYLGYLLGALSAARLGAQPRRLVLAGLIATAAVTAAAGWVEGPAAWIALRGAGWGSVLSAIGTVAYYAAYAYIVWRTLHGEFSIGDLTFLAGSFRRLRNLLEGLLMGFSQVAGQALYLDDLFSFFEIEPEIVQPPSPQPFPVPLRQGFAFENVGFRYPGAERWAVRGLNFELRAGEILALVGENGAGKTTIVKLLARLYDPDEGRILLDGHDLREYDLFALRANIGVIFQDFMRYHFTAADNIAVGRIEARDDRARIVAAAERSLADEVIRKLPQGYDQMIGKRFRTGIDLSGGEWQKVAIARAYMRDAQLLILDEPTAALDARSEFEVFKRFKELSLGKTVVLISHRFSSVRMADRIVVLVDGAVEAMGTHAELLEQRGRYAELFELQAAGYR